MNLKNRLRGDIAPIIKNFTFLSINNALSFLLQLLLIPYLTRHLGLVHYGIVALGQVVCLYMGVVIDYGFGYSGTRQVSIQRNSPRNLSYIFSAILNAKILLGIIVLVGSAIILYIIPKFNVHFIFFILSFPIVIGQSLIPLWFFQGLEKMKYITLFNSTAKILAAIVIFLIIREEKDYIYVNFIQGMFSVGVGLISVFFAFKKFGLAYYSFRYEMIIVQIKRGFNIFISSLASNICVSSSLLILGAIGKPESVALYSVVDKVYGIMRIGLSVLFSVVYPRACSLATKSQQELKEFLKNYYSLFTLGVIILSLGIVFFSDEVTYYLIGKENTTASLLLKLMPIAPIITVIGSPLGMYILANNAQKRHAFVVVVCSILNILVGFILVNHLEAVGSIFSLIITEFAASILYYLFAKRMYFQFQTPKTS